MKKYNFIKYSWMSYGLINGIWPLWKNYNGKDFKFKVKLDPSWYVKDTGKPEFFNTQKIFGIKLGHNNDNSIRLGFRPNQLSSHGNTISIIICFYCHIDTNYHWFCEEEVFIDESGEFIYCDFVTGEDSYLCELKFKEKTRIAQIGIKPQKGRFSGLYDEDNKQRLEATINLY